MLGRRKSKHFRQTERTAMKWPCNSNDDNRINNQPGTVEMHRKLSEGYEDYLAQYMIGEL